MTRRGGRAIRALVALVALLGMGVLTAPPAQADEPVALVSIRLDRIDPALPTRDGTITLAGSVKNITKQPLVRLRALFWRNQAPITTSEGIDQALTSASNDPIGARVDDRAYQDLFSEAKPDLAPGASVKFTLKVEVADLALSSDPGVYLVGVHVLQNSVNLAVGRARVFVPVLDKAPKAAIRLTSIVQLSSRPSLLRAGVLTDDHLATEVAPGGRLDALMRAADTDQTSFAVDPELVAELTTMKAGYQVAGLGDTTSAGTGQADAGRWLDALQRLLGRRDGYRLPYANPDLAALVHDGQRAPIRASTAAGKLVQATAALPLLVIPAGGAADLATMKAAGGLHPKAIVLADTTVPDGTGPLLDGLDQRKTPVVRYSSAALGGGPGPEPSDTPVQIQQRMLADTWIEATSIADDSAHGRVRLITDAAQAKGDGTRGEEAAIDAPWLRPSSLTDLLDTRPAAWDHKLRYPTTARLAELSADQLVGLRRFNATSSTYADLLVDGSAVRTAGRAAVARATSAAWRGEADARRRFLDPQQMALDTILTSKVMISSTAVVNTAGQRVEFPITIKNLLPADPNAPDANAVKVQLVFSSDNSQRLSIQTIDVGLGTADATPLRAQSNVSRNAKVTAKANGVVPVRAQLLTDTGKPVGRPVTISVRVTQNGTLGWVIALAAGVVLAGSTALRIRQVTRERARPLPARAWPETVLSSATPTATAGDTDGPGARDV